MAVFPAPAGMNRTESRVVMVVMGVPRTRGDEPAAYCLEVGMS